MSLRAVDLFCGAGGSSLGAAMADVQMVGAIDADPLAARTYEKNFPGAKVVAGRLNQRNGTKLLSDVGRVDLLLASPECTNHSVARGAREVDLDSLRSGLFVLPFLREWQPRFLVLENVSRMRRWDGWTKFLEMLSSEGYRHSVVILNAEDFGVPQSRRRMFLLASRDHEPPTAIRRKGSKARTVAAILDKPGTYPAQSIYRRPRPLAPATMERIKRGRKELATGDDFLIVYYGSDAAGGWQSIDRPLRTLTTLDRFGLVSGTGRDTTLRMLQVPELQRAMGFPEQYEFGDASRRDKIRLLGNAVCPPVMKAVIEALTA